jgi:hypothetical protein
LYPPLLRSPVAASARPRPVAAAVGETQKQPRLLASSVLLNTVLLKFYDLLRFPATEQHPKPAKLPSARNFIGDPARHGYAVTTESRLKELREELDLKLDVGALAVLLDRHRVTMPGIVRLSVHPELKSFHPTAYDVQQELARLISPMLGR